MQGLSNGKTQPPEPGATKRSRWLEVLRPIDGATTSSRTHAARSQRAQSSPNAGQGLNAGTKTSLKSPGDGRDKGNLLIRKLLPLHGALPASDSARPKNASRYGPVCRAGFMEEIDGNEETYAKEIVARLSSSMMAQRRQTRGMVAIPMSRSDPEFRWTSSFLAMLAEIPDSMTLAAKEIAKEQTLDLIALSPMKAMGLSNPRISSARTVALLKMRAAIESRLSDPTLDPASTANAAGVSVRYANSLLAEQSSSITRLIRTRRLERSRMALEGPLQRHRTITEIAYGWGFSDMIHFGLPTRSAARSLRSPKARPARTTAECRDLFRSPWAGAAQSKRNYGRQSWQPSRTLSARPITRKCRTPGTRSATRSMLQSRASWQAATRRRSRSFMPRIRKRRAWLAPSQRIALPGGHSDNERRPPIA